VEIGAAQGATTWVAAHPPCPRSGLAELEGTSPTLVKVDHKEGPGEGGGRSFVPPLQVVGPGGADPAMPRLFPELVAGIRRQGLSPLARLSPIGKAST